MPADKKPLDNNTQTRILNAARKVFTEKGYAATRTRDIAREAGINLALVNYYFRSKDDLFGLVMFENIQHFVKGVQDILNDEATSLYEKTARFTAHYTHILTANPDLPLFILGELRRNPDELVEKMGVKTFLPDSVYFRQIAEHARDSGSNVHPIHIFINTLALTVFPFIAAPILKNLGDLTQEQFNALTRERAENIPAWLRAMFSIS